MKNVLVINCGSSSLKYQLINMENEEVLAKGLFERIAIPGSKLTHEPEGREKFKIEKDVKNHTEAIALVLEALTDKDHGVIKDASEIYAIGHRVVQGGVKYPESVVITDEVKKDIEKYSDLAPLHNPANLMGIEAVEKAMPGVPNVAAFDTSFGMGMPEKAYKYAIPNEYYENYHIRRYGFHGTSHMYVSQEAIKFAGLDKDTARVIVCHLGNGASISASVGGKCIDSSMGLTPLEGLIMGTRSGDIDPAIVQYICKKENKSVDEMLDILNKKSGVLGMSGGVSSDFRDIENAEADGNNLAKVALEAFRYRIIKYVGAYVAAMGGVDALCFTAGVGENDKITRQIVGNALGFIGAKVDEEANNVRGKRTMISTPDSKVKIMLMPTNEELAIARDTYRLAKK